MQEMRTIILVSVLLALILQDSFADPRAAPVYEQEDIQIATDHWALELAPGTNPFDIAEKHGHEVVGALKTIPGVYLFKKKADTQHGVTHPHHEESSEITWFENQVARQRYKRNLPSDPSFESQWHLHLTDTTTAHINVETAWNQNITGDGITIAVVDDGLEHTHPDIQPNYQSASSYDFNYNDANPYPDTSSDDHGTSAAGVAGARDNSVCGVGSAYRAKLAGLRLISRASTDSQEAEALNYMWNLNHIYSNSWGPIDDGRRKEGPGRLASLALRNGVQQGRDGKGSIFIWAGGNGKRSNDNCNYDGWANSIYTISIAAVDHKGIQAWYSEPCSMLVVSAPSSGSTLSITTTDLQGIRGTTSNDCTSSFGGTSAAAPLVAGVAALILEANPALTWRDVQAIFIQSASQNDPTDSNWHTNGGGFHYNHKYGFGLVDASRAVDLARTWQNLSPQVSITQNLDVNQDIPENGWLETSINIGVSFTVEHATVRFVATHPRRGDLVIQLVSPSGTTSILAERHSDSNANYDWTFGSIFNWGENSQGQWKLRVNDAQSGRTGSLTNWELTLFGHS